MNDNYIDVNYTDSINDKKYYTINEISNELQVKEEDIVFWISKLNDILKINSVGMFQLFTPTDVKNISQIKHWIIDENKTIEEIKDFLSQENNLVIIKQKSEQEIEIVNIFSKVLQMQSDEINEIKQTNKQILDYNQKMIKMLIQFITQYTTNNSNQKSIIDKINNLAKSQIDNMNEILNIKNNQQKLHQEIAITVEGTLDKKLKESHNKYECKVDELEKQQTEKFAKLSEDIRKKSEERVEHEKEKKKNHNIFNFKNWFKK